VHTGQSAIELITVYSWAFLIIAIFVAVAALLALSRPVQNTIFSACNIQPSLPCTDTLLASGSSSSGTNIRYAIIFVNNLQKPIYIPAGGFNLTTTGLGVSGTQSTYGSCYPSFILVGSPAVCNVVVSGHVQPSSGSLINTLFAITYSICGNDSSSTCPTPAYRSTGYAEQTIAPSYPTFYLLNISARGYGSGYVSGTNAGGPILTINGAPYANGQTALLQAGNYVMGAAPSSGYVFSSWSFLSTTSTLSNSLSPNAILTMSADANIIGTYTQSVCSPASGSCYLLHVGYGIYCPYTCNTLISCGLSRNKCS